MIAGLIATVTPSDTVPVEGGSMLLCVAAGNVALKGTQPGAAALAAFAMTAGQQIYVPGNFYVMATGTTASVAVMG